MGLRLGPSPRPPSPGPSAGPPSPEPPSTRPPKISPFFSSPTIFFLPYLAGLLVEFWWCLKRQDPQMCTFGVLELPCETPAALGQVLLPKVEIDQSRSHCTGEQGLSCWLVKLAVVGLPRCRVLRQFAKAKTLHEPPQLRTSARMAWLHRWSILACGGAQALSVSLMARSGVGSNGAAPSMAEVFMEARCASQF